MTVVVQSSSSPEMDVLLAKVQADHADRSSREALARFYIRKRDVANAVTWFSEADALVQPAEKEVLERIQLAVDHEVYDYALALLQPGTWTVPEAYRVWSFALSAAKRHDDAIAKANEGLSIFPGEPLLLYGAARALFMAGRYADAAHACSNLVEIQPNDGKTLRLYGESLRLCGKPRAAIAQFEKIPICDPAFIRDSSPRYVGSFYNGWGNALFSLRRHAEALDKYKAAANVNAAKAVFWNNVGAAHFASDEWYEAVVAYRKAVALEPGDPLATPALAIAQWRAGLFADAEAQFETAKKAGGTSIIPAIMYCTSLWRAGRYRDARVEAHALRDHYRRHRAAIVASQPSDLADAAEVFATMIGDFETAEQALADAEVADESEFDFAERQLSRAVVSFARAERQFGDHRRAAQLAASACRSAIHRILQRFAENASDPRVEGELQIVGRAYLLLEDLPKALHYLGAAIQCPSTTSDTLVVHALLSIRQRDFAGAIRMLQAALARDPEDVATRVLLADAFYRAGDLERGEVEARAVLRRAPGTVEAHLVLANVSIELADKGDGDLYQQALTELDQAWSLIGTLAGSKVHSPSLAAQICYLRGYIRIRVYNDQEAKLPALLVSARDDFRKSLRFDDSNHAARMALQRIEQRRRAQHAGWIGDQLAGGMCAVFAMAVFGTAANRFSLGLLSAGYALVFLFGSMIFLIASFYLPQLMKLKVGSVELEKATVEGTISKLPLQIRKMQAT